MSDKSSGMAQVKELRERTGAGIVDCKNALKDSDGEVEKAITLLREKGLAAAAKRAGREAVEGMVGSYIHGAGNLGVLIEVNCETDFVARTEQFQQLIKDLAMQVAASNPRYVRREEVPVEEVEKERSIYRTQVQEAGKPEHVIEKIIDGKLEKYFGENCLLEQAFIRDTGKTVEQLVKEMVARTGENIIVRRFARFQIGEAGGSTE